MAIARIDIVEIDGSAEDLADRTRNLREELLELDVDDVDAVAAGPPPPGSRALDSETLGALLVTVQQSIPVASALIDTVKDWVGRNSSTGCTVRVTVGDKSIEITGTSTENQDKLVQQFVSVLAD
jgi:hypothetical protein